MRKILPDLRYDLPASLVVFLVALPLSLGIAIASGAPLMAGLIAAVSGGIIAGSVGGSVLQVSGPAAGLTVVVAGLIDEFGWEMTCVITVCAGAVQILLGLVRVARAALAVAPVVVHAMLAGIGVTIVLQQIHVLLGGSSRSSAWANIEALPSGILNHELHEVIVGSVVIAILLLWPKLPPKVRFIPGALVAIVAATALSLLVDLQVERIQLSGNFFEAIGLPHLPPMAPGGQPWTQEIGAIALGVVTVALIASVESLLSAVGIDKLHSGPRTNFNREMLGQGSANVVSGLLGGLPVTGVIVRSSTNVAAGARTRASAVLHGVWILLFASLLTNLVELIPKAALAGLLIVIGIQLIKLAHVKVAVRTGNFVIYAITIVCVVFLNLLEGVAIGLAIAILFLLVRVVRAPIEARPIGGEPKRWHVDIDGTLSFLLLPRLTNVLSTLPPGSDVTLNLNADYIDHSVSEAISDWKTAHEATGGSVHIVETSPANLSSAHSSPPKRHYTARSLREAPWPSRRDTNKDGADASILDGVRHYHRNGVGALHHHVAELVGSPNPDTLFLTCADSRILPDTITASRPGDLYIVRNVGNLVPTNPAERSVDAALDFAVNQLGVTSVVVCGHSSCRAMQVVLDDDAEVADRPIGRWLQYAKDSFSAFRANHPARVSSTSNGFTFSELDQLSIVNVAVQVERLTRHPLLAPLVATGQLRVVGIFFDFATVHVHEVNEHGIVPTTQAAREAVSALG
ncbi:MULTISPECIES: SulP family inorganic anion transporter [Mycobacterium]|jgi:carbonic anhydrase|uniref:carbonic anhydrase n=1 Tax=Mycobacterium gordonae TaxID=1778 RepID=A0A1A6BCL4_MYCGO|nr:MULTISPECIES: bifunctional SulP family inorganic anion transporter/carbonic anhydrase [Mycobacterium]MBI2700206.1 bifunctional SulP family inorganic anion transporter/carbonic anhydrase [Mycobacterium sp.]MCQ4365375.1 bifunctional SulP family inorganic anion transporter/carbonic anhydrase [Mycobacterium gordonae]MCV7009933.1 bifunctional SulP family inorganic anion transporter/carbonic anhydrase [Mycobacterium gordonae]OBS00112.1 carbonic anhydrase [Mycobacterium gordonae]ODR22060.1 carboni